MTAHVEVMDLVARLKAAERGLRAGDGGAHGIGDGGQGRSQGDHPSGRHHRRRLDRRRLRARRGAQGRARGAGRRRAAHGVGAAGGSARRARREARREPRRRALRQNMCPSKGTMDIFVEPVLPHPSLVILGASPVAMSLADRRGNSAIMSPLRRRRGICRPARRRHAGRRLPARRSSPRPALRRRFDARQGRRGGACARPWRSTPNTAPSSAAAARWRRCAKSSSRKASPPTRSTMSRRRRVSISAPSRPRKSRCRSWPKSPSSDDAASARRGNSRPHEEAQLSAVTSSFGSPDVNFAGRGGSEPENSERRAPLLSSLCRRRRKDTDGISVGIIGVFATVALGMSLLAGSAASQKMSLKEQLVGDLSDSRFTHKSTRPDGSKFSMCRYQSQRRR